MKLLSTVVLTFLSVSAGAVYAQTQASNTVEITLDQGTNMAVALSPDEKTLAIDLQGTIWTLPASGGAATGITDALGDCHEPAWSPDGNFITFHSYRSGSYHIWIVRKDGTGLRQLTFGPDDDREPDWSPDGKTIVFSSDRDGNYDLWQVDVQSGNITQLTYNPFNEYHPAVAPDGAAIAYVAEGSAAGIHVLKGGQSELMHATRTRLAAPSWSRDGNRLSFTSFEREMTRLYLMNVADRNVSMLSENEDLFPFRAAWLGSEAFLYTANGQIRKRLAVDSANFITVPFQAAVTLERPAYKRRVYNFDDRSKKTAQGIVGPSVSPDGKSVAFVALGDLYLQTERNRVKALTNDSHVELDPDWSPDGRTLAFVSDRSGRFEIWLHDLETDLQRKLATDLSGAASTPVWSRKGDRIAFFQKDMNEWGRGVLYSMDAGGGDIRRHHSGVFVPGKPSWSPDGKTIAIMALQPSSSRFREGLNRFMLIPVDGSATKFVGPGADLSPGIRGQNGPVWSPDGEQMAYIQDGVLWCVPVNHQGEPAGVPLQITTELAEKPSWAGDSRHLVYLSVDGLKKINVISRKAEPIRINLKWRNQVPNDRYLIHTGRLFNGIDSVYHRDVDVLIEGGRIAQIRPHKVHRPGLRIVDAGGKVVMPGLIESHSHQHNGEGEKLGKVWLANGITSVREPGADPYDALERKESWANGARVGPRLFSGGMLDGSRVYYGLSNTVVKMEHIALEMERAKKLGYDMIKTYARMPDSLQMEIVKAAHRIGIPVSSHEIYPAAKYNVDAVEHFRGTSRRGYSPKQSSLNHVYDDAIKIIAGAKMPVTPTAVMHEGFLKITRMHPEILNDRRITDYFPGGYADSWRSRRTPENYGPNFSAFTGAVNRVLGLGGIVTAGTDSPFVPYGASLHAELWLYVEGGLSPFRALQTATIRAAENIGVASDLGSIEKGKLADLLIIDGDPLNNILDSWKIETVIKGGRIYSRGDIE